ncbi:DUF3626 domain-containing protein [Bacteriovorax sp. PP10]|uniref:DUF3626 domain-containing protein n=1 Tax=Bacteriovorax antarcticus TaxID=3088717 RepID=A0ABU5VR09_9BACT|nr:DUF3626 domain-containing protein [Bacteriovorax sp. PP10]MEA9355347.1 DUF3626 domain-containing protein [Bacteriovorax sp. PP10]
MSLAPSQLAAIDYVQKYAQSRRSEAQETITHLLRMSNITSEVYEQAVLKLKRNAKVAVHFHPDRLDSQMKSVAEALHTQGIYKGQFETLLSSGSVSAHPGGARDNWENRLYNGAYNLEGSENHHRPKYGALNVMCHQDGPAPRFGSCYFVLKSEVSSRCTFTYLDSHQDPKEKGTLAEFDDILAAFLTEAFTRDYALGEKDLTIPKLIKHLSSMDKTHDFSSKRIARNLNHYIEAQIHGNISLADDVEELVADPAFKGTETGNFLEAICKDYKIKILWHQGYALDLNEVPLDFRGPTMPSLAKRVATTSYLDTQMIGVAAASLKQDPAAWSDRGTYSEVLQELKLLWHVLVTFGKPLSTFKS